jgi:cytosine/adenosine deaminase-related metal-dependent hydrolase
MLLQNLKIVGQDSLNHIRIVGDKIEEIASGDKAMEIGRDEVNITFENALAFPGLINSHDHLEFDLFPQLANRTYRNYKEWGPDIHTQNAEAIQSIMKIPESLRIQWGIYKNLLNGFTTVVHHGDHLDIENPVTAIFEDCYSLHSVGLEKGWRYKLNRPFLKNWPFVVHIGEGTDVAAFEEINQLIKWNIFRRKIIGVHGVAMTAQQARSFEAVVWCPDSNFFLLNTTAKVDDLKAQTKILFGTDSTLSANWNAWEQIRLARKTNMLSDQELLASLTTAPAAVWGLEDRGVLAEGKKADIVVAEMKYFSDPMNSFFELNPENILLVVRDGGIVLFDESLSSQLQQNEIVKMSSKVAVNSTVKFVKGNLPELMQETRRFSQLTFPFQAEFQKIQHVGK